MNVKKKIKRIGYTFLDFLLFPLYMTTLNNTYVIDKPKLKAYAKAYVMLEKEIQKERKKQKITNGNFGILERVEEVFK